MQSTKCCLLHLGEMTLDTHRLNSYENRNTKSCPTLIVACQGYSCHLLLISSASVRSLSFLSFIMLTLAWDVPLISQVFLKISLFFPILLFSSNSLHCTLKKAVQSLQNQRSSELNLPILIALSSLIPKMSVFTLANLLLDHIQFTLIHGPNIQGSISILFFTGSDFCFHHQTHPQLKVISTLAQPLHSFWSYFSSLPQQHIEHLSNWVGVWGWGSSSSVISFCLFLLFMGQEYWSDLPFPPPVNHVVRSYIIKGISYARRSTIRDRNDKDLRRNRQA